VRRFLSVVACASLIAALAPAIATAAPPLRESETATNLSCEGLTGDVGIVNFFAIVNESFDSFAFAGLALWTTGDPASTDPNVVGGGSVDWDGLTMTASFDLVELVWSTDPNEPPVEVPAGTASLDVTLAPDGKPLILSSFKDHSGNRTSSGMVAFQPRSVEGALAIDLLTEPAADYDLSRCSASSTTQSFSVTNPTALISVDSHVLFACRWETPDGHVGLGGIPDRFVAVEVYEGEDIYIGGDDEPMTDSAYEAEYTLYEARFTGDEVGLASASAVFTRAEPLNIRDQIHDLKVDISGWRLSVEGTLNVALPSGTKAYVMDDASCYAEEVTIKTIRTDPGGPKLKNDAPSDAIPLALGETVSVWTGVSATEPEVPCAGGGFFADGISHTGWWTFVGTGGEVTIDTAGSSFSTILGVYLAVSSGFEQVACVAFGPDGGSQAAITLDTVAGTTYFVQAGGFGPSGSGQLVLTID
jgi:hypothetical protein